MFTQLKHTPFFRSIAVVVITAFIAMIPAQSGYAQVVMQMPPVGQMIHQTGRFEPALMAGIRVDMKDPFSFYFIMDRGEKELADDVKKDEYSKLIKYFLSSLTIANDDMWVNLSPIESDRIIPENFSLTEMGRDLLAQDYVLKQFTSSLMYPEDAAGKEFWQKLYAQAYAKYGTTDIPIDTFNKVWITADKAQIYQKDDTAFLVDSHLKVMLEQDFKLIEQNKGQFGSSAVEQTDAATVEARKLASDVVREVIVPLIEKEVNEGESFAQVRQVYSAMIMATWFKKTLKQSLLGQAYADKNRLAGIESNDPNMKEKIYQQYLDAYKVGVFNYIKEEVDPGTDELLPRKYFSGGLLAVDNAALTDASEADTVKAFQKKPRRWDAAKALLMTVVAGTMMSFANSAGAAETNRFSGAFQRMGTGAMEAVGGVGNVLYGTGQVLYASGEWVVVETGEVLTDVKEVVVDTKGGVWVEKIVNGVKTPVRVVGNATSKAWKAITGDNKTDENTGGNKIAQTYQWLGDKLAPVGEGAKVRVKDVGGEFGSRWKSLFGSAVNLFKPGTVKTDRVKVTQLNETVKEIQASNTVVVATLTTAAEQSAEIALEAKAQTEEWQSKAEELAKVNEEITADSDLKSEKLRTLEEQKAASDLAKDAEIASLRAQLAAAKEAQSAVGNVQEAVKTAKAANDQVVEADKDFVKAVKIAKAVKALSNGNAQEKAAAVAELSTRSDWPKWAGLAAIFGMVVLIFALKNWLAKRQKEIVAEVKADADKVVAAVEEKGKAEEKVKEAVIEVEKKANVPELQEKAPVEKQEQPTEQQSEINVPALTELQAQIEQTENDLQKVRDAINAIRAKIPRASDRENEYNLQYRGNLPKGQNIPSRMEINQLKKDRALLIRQERALEKKLAALRNGDVVQAPQITEEAGALEDQPVVVVGPEAWAKVTQEGLEQVVPYLREKLGEGFDDVWGIFVKDDKVSYVENFKAGIDLYNEQQAVVKDLPEAEISALKELGSALDLIAANIDEMAQRKALDQKLVNALNAMNEQKKMQQEQEIKKPAEKPADEPVVTPVVVDKTDVLSKAKAVVMDLKRRADSDVNHEKVEAREPTVKDKWNWNKVSREIYQGHVDALARYTGGLKALEQAEAKLNEGVSSADLSTWLDNEIKQREGSLELADVGAVNALRKMKDELKKSVGGIDLGEENLTIDIKVDGVGMPLPVEMQDPTMINLQGLSPVIREIAPIGPMNVPVLSQLMEMAGAAR